MHIQPKHDVNAERLHANHCTVTLSLWSHFSLLTQDILDEKSHHNDVCYNISINIIYCYNYITVLTEGATSKWKTRESGTFALTPWGRSESTSMEESVELPWRGTVTCNEVLELWHKTMSLFTRFGNWSVRRRTKRVFPRPPRFDDTTRTHNLWIDMKAHVKIKLNVRLTRRKENLTIVCSTKCRNLLLRI